MEITIDFFFNFEKSKYQKTETSTFAWVHADPLAYTYFKLQYVLVKERKFEGWKGPAN